MSKSKILVAMNDAKITGYYAEVLERNGYTSETLSSVSDAKQRLNKTSFTAVLTDFSSDGKQLLESIVLQHPETRCIIISKKASVRDSVDAIKRGAFHYISKTDGPKEFITTVENAMGDQSYTGPRRRKSDLPQSKKFGEIIGDSPVLLNVFRAIEKVSLTDSTVLITGESGTGKELIARAIHFNSDRRPKPQVVINCGAIPGELLESELFGHEKGAFTGAHRTRIGRFEMADGGTIFLDEIGDMSPDLQVKLLRVLQEHSFERVGSTKSIKVDVRIIAATNKDLLHSIEESKFREDLYYRLNVIPIHVPPLRERRSDIQLLMDYFLKRMGGRRRQDRKRMKSFSDEAMELVLKYNWPGNIRELENLIERLSVLVEEDVIQVQDLPEKIRGDRPRENQAGQVPFEPGIGFNEAVEQYQKDLILQALNQTNWVKAKAADLLKMNRTTLVEKIKKMQLEPPPVSKSERGVSESLSSS